LNPSTQFTQTLVNRLKARDEAALSLLYDHYAGALYGIIHKILQNSDAAEETLHDAFLKIWEQIDRFDSQKGTLFTWMYRIARNQAIDRKRSKAFKAADKSVDIGQFVNTFKVAENYQNQGVRELLNRMEASCKKLIHLNFFMGYTHSDISDMEDMPLGTVKTRLRNCLKSFRKLVAKEIG